MNRRIFRITSSAIPGAGSGSVSHNTEPGLPSFFAIRIERINEHSIKSKMNNNLVHVSWQVSAGMDASYFELQRSSNQRDFDTIETIMVLDNSKSVSRYATTDSKYSFFNDKLYYRLKVVLKNGKVNFTDEIAMDLGRFATASINDSIYSRSQQ